MPNRWFHRRRRPFGYEYGSVSAYLEQEVRKPVVDETRRRGADGVDCGHIHHAEMRELDGILYCNDGHLEPAPESRAI